jgi:type II secretory pathway pseudopilin PulG
VEIVVAIGIILVLFGLTVSATVVIVQKSEIRQTENTLELLATALQEWEIEADRKVRWGKDGVPFAESKFDMQYTTAHVYTVSEFMDTIGRSQRAKAILAKIEPEFLHEYDSENDPVVPPWLPTTGDADDPDPLIVLGANPAREQYDQGDWDGQLAVLDAWGTPIRVVHPGRVADAVTFGPDDVLDPTNDLVNMEDQTVFIDTESHNGETFYGTELFYGVAKNRSILFVSAGPDGKFGDLSQDADEGGDERLHDQAHDNVYSYPIEDLHEE